MDKRANGGGRGRRQWLGRHLMLKGEYAELLLSGRKRATIRLGVVRPKYREVIIHGGGRPRAKAVIEGVEVKRVE
ncbi:MAG: ASCH domain-containing protein, partial [Desulfurococcales archaeon]|nr:ASCH domain-containing protein [Desulfurococcales archaeon]